MTAPVVSRAEWLTLKRSNLTLGSSSAAAACGLDGYRSTFALYCELRGECEREDASGREAVYWGNVLERVVIGETLKRCALEPVDLCYSSQREALESTLARIGAARVECYVQDGETIQPMLVSIERPWQIATLDAVALDGPDLVVIEAKTASAYKASDWADGKCPDAYRVQALHQLAVSGLPRVILAALIGGQAFKAVEIPREVGVDYLCSIESELIRRVQSGDAPKADGSESSYRTLSLLHPDDNGKTIVLPTVATSITAEIAQLHEKLAPLSEESERIGEEIASREALIRQMIGGNTFGLLPDGSGKWSLKTQRTPGGGTTRVLRSVERKRK